jgi:glycosyltransferase involved in cell wall biosynthesis
MEPVRRSPSVDILKYVLITAARNEERLIGRTLAAVIAQTQRPERWAIVDDGSVDGTAEIVDRTAREHPWIVLVRRPARADRSFSGKAQAVNAGLEQLKDLEFEIIGNLDADVTFDPDYMEFVLGKFGNNPTLGIAGTPFTEVGYDSSRDSFEGENYVAGPCQLFRYQCFQDIGGYVAHKAGGVDWIAVMTARMKGWEVRSYPEKRFHHHRSLGTAERGPLQALFSYGEKDYYLGGSPIWQLFRATYRMANRPFFFGGLALGLGYAWAALRRTPRPVSAELMRFHRADQMKKLKAIFQRLLEFKKVDSFSVGTKPDSPARPIAPNNVSQ